MGVSLPCMVRHCQWHTMLPDTYTFEYKLFDPTSQEVHDIWDRINMNPCCWDVYTLASKQGWLLYGSRQGKSLFLHNPFTNDMRLLSNCFENHSSRAAIKGNPRSSKCEIFILDICDMYLHIQTYKSCGHKSEIIVGKVRGGLYSVVYMNQNIHCLFIGGNLYSYSLKDKSWRLLASRFPGPFVDPIVFYYSRKCWLLEIKGNLIMVIMDVQREEGNMFRFDWSEKSWVMETSLKYCAIYISGNVAFAGLLSDCYGEKLEECRVFHYNDDDRGVRGYSLSKSGRIGIEYEEYAEIEHKEYNRIRRFWMHDASFVEPPYFGT